MHECNVPCRLADAIAKFWHMPFRSYYSALVKLTNLRWGNVELVHKAAVVCANDVRDDPRALQAKRKVNNCSTGRWGAVTLTEQYYRKFEDVQFVLRVMDLVIESNRCRYDDVNGNSH